MQVVGEPEAGTVSTAQAMALLLMEHPDELKKLQRDGFIKSIGRDSWRLVDLVQGFARARKPDAAAPVSSAAVAAHLACVPSYIRKLVEQGVIERRSDGKFDQDQCRTKYLAHLREERKRSPKSAAEVEFTSAKAELIRLRIDEKRRTTIHIEEAMDREDKLIGMFLSALSSLPAQCAPLARLAGRLSHAATRVARSGANAARWRVDPR
jgi:hypothetical protein